MPAALISWLWNTVRQYQPLNTSRESCITPTTSFHTVTVGKHSGQVVGVALSTLMDNSKWPLYRKTYINESVTESESGVAQVCTALPCCGFVVASAVVCSIGAKIYCKISLSKSACQNVPNAEGSEDSEDAWEMHVQCCVDVLGIILSDKSRVYVVPQW